jgi:hypothetical protein
VIELALILAFAGGAILGWCIGWNSACRMECDRDIARARECYQQDRK